MIEVNGQRFETEDDFKAAIFVVDTKSGHRVPFRRNAPQQHMRREMVRLGGQWFIITKARQLGVTEDILKDFFFKLLTQYPLKAAIVSHEGEATQRLLDRVRVTYNNLPDWFKPPIYHNSDNEMSWPSLGSSIYIGTAGSKAFGRGDTFHLILLSEYAHWNPTQAAKIRLGLQESCPSTGQIIIECSPNGEGNEHHQLYLAAKAGKSPYKALFLPWFVNKHEYKLSPGHPLAIVGTEQLFQPTLYEKFLMEANKLTLDNIRWRRSKIAGFTARPDVGNNLELAEMFFKQEYPEDDTSCFVSLSQSIFSAEQIARLLSSKKEPKYIDERGVKWWSFPLPGRVYAVACDPATVWGVDKAVILGLDITDYPKVLHVATWEGKPTDTALAERIRDMAVTLNNAHVIVEYNGPGQSVLNTLINVLRYWNVFYQSDPFNTNVPMRPGWLTTAPSKRKLIQEGISVVNGGYLYSEDAQLSTELQYFKHYGETDSYEAAPGQHDDYVIALLLGLQAATTAPRTVGTTNSQPYGWKW